MIKVYHFTNRNSMDIHGLLFKLCLATIVLPMCRSVNTTITNVEIINTTGTSSRTAEFLENTCTKNITALAYKEECCDFIVERFRSSWYKGGYYLTEYLSNLQKLGCKEFESECQIPVYNFTNFTKLVYDRFCNRNALLAKCTEELYQILRNYHFRTSDIWIGKNLDLKITEEIWNNLTTSLVPYQMKMKDLNNPCVEVALFDRTSGGVGRFHEIVQVYTPFCTMQWNGYDIETAMTRHVSPWTSMSLWCRGSVIICQVIIAILGFAIIVANVIVLSVYMSSPELRNSQGIYKLSIAIGDLFSGIIVMPNIIVFHYWMFVHERLMGNMMDGESERRHAGGGIRSYIPTPYINFVGFFTTFSLTLSIYTLIVASVDRFLAVFRPLKYNRSNAKRHAKYACLGVWIFVILISIIPLVFPTLSYKIILATMVTSIGPAALILVSIAFGIPLIMLCLINCFTFYSAKQHARAREDLNRSMLRRNSDNGIENRLRQILGLMVSVFISCVFPTFLLTIMAIFFGNILHRNPNKFNSEAATIYQSVQYCAILLLLSNSLWNFFIYNSRGEDFRKAVKSLKIVKVVITTAGCITHSARRLSKVSVHYRRRKSRGSTDITSASRTISLPEVETTIVMATNSNTTSGTNKPNSHNKHEYVNGSYT
ncbi:uncharacterized protein LOC120345819 [Styela clava]